MAEQKAGILTDYGLVADHSVYRATCSCGWVDVAYFVRWVAEVKADRHLEYHAEVARITARPDGATGTTEAARGPEARSDD